VRQQKQNITSIYIGDISRDMEKYSYNKIKRPSNEDLFTLTLTGYPPPNYWINCKKFVKGTCITLRIKLRNVKRLIALEEAKASMFEFFTERET